MPRFRYSLCMRFSLALLLCGVVAAAPSLFAQQTASAPSQSAAQSTTPAAPSQPAATPAQSTTTPALHLESLPPLPHALTPAQEQALRTKRILSAVNTLARSEANWGPAMSTPGDSLRVIDKGHKSTPEGTQVTFGLNVTGFQPGDSLRLLRWPLDSRVQQVTSGLTVDSAGQVICPEISQGDCLTTMQPGDPVQVHDVAARGEPLRLAIVSADGKKRAESTIIPFPLETTSNSCKMEVILGTKDAGLVLLEGAGFPKSEKVEIHIVTDGKDNPVTTTTSATGGLLVAVLAGSGGHTSGTTTISYHGDSCSPSLSFPWGKDSYHPQ